MASSIGRLTPVPKKMHKYKVGERVKYVGGRYGDDDSNPLWGGRYGKIGGTIYDHQEDGEYQVKWDNKESNGGYSDTELQVIVEKPKTDFKKAMILLLGDIYVQNELTNERILELLAKMAEELEEEEKEKEEEEEEEDDDEDEEEEEEGEENEGDEEDKKEAEQREKEKEAEAKKKLSESLISSLGSALGSKPMTPGGSTLSAADIKKAIGTLAKIGSPIEPFEDEDEKPAKALPKILKMMPSAPPASRSGGGVSDGDVKITGTIPEKVWCGVCKKEHTKGTHD